MAIFNLGKFSMSDRKKRKKDKINKLSEKHSSLHGSVVEGHGQSEYSSGDYDKDYDKLGKIEDKLSRKEKRYQKKYGESPYSLISNTKNTYRKGGKKPILTEAQKEKRRQNEKNRDKSQQDKSMYKHK